MFQAVFLATRDLSRPPVLGAFLPRRIHFMVKYEAWTAPVLGLIVRSYDSFPVHRGEVDLAAYRQALKLLAAGKVVGIFPEGTRSRDGRLHAGQPGAILLSQRSKAPIVPVGIWGLREPGEFPQTLLRREVLCARPPFPRRIIPCMAVIMGEKG